jgi:IS1 family transposase
MVTGNRDIETMQRLYEQLKKFKNAVFATDDWDAFAAVLPKDRHKIGKRHTHAIERHILDFVLFDTNAKRSKSLKYICFLPWLIRIFL